MFLKRRIKKAEIIKLKGFFIIKLLLKIINNYIAI